MALFWTLLAYVQNSVLPGLNPVTGWPCFGLYRLAEEVLGMLVLILLLDGQVLDKRELDPSLYGEKS